MPHPDVNFMSFRKKQNSVSPCWQNHYHFPPTSQGFLVGGRSWCWHQQPTECPMPSLDTFCCCCPTKTQNAQKPRDEATRIGKVAPSRGLWGLERGRLAERHTILLPIVESWLYEWMLLRTSLCLKAPWVLGQDAVWLHHTYWILHPKISQKQHCLVRSTFLKHFCNICNILFQCFASFNTFSVYNGPGIHIIPFNYQREQHRVLVLVLSLWTRTLRQR